MQLFKLKTKIEKKIKNKVAVVPMTLSTHLNQSKKKMPDEIMTKVVPWSARMATPRHHTQVEITGRTVVSAVASQEKVVAV
jgi:hypothetical protein